MTSISSSAHDLLRERFRWVDGHADIWPLFGDGDGLKAVAEALAGPFRTAAVTAVCGVESRGFLLGGLVARELGVGFVPVRKAGGLFPGEKLERTTEPDYRGNRHTLRLQRASVRPGDRVLLVDDWIETGNQALAVHALVTAAGAEVVGCAVLIDELRSDVRPRLPAVHALVSGDELPVDG
jgi:adenine phosphoribosyltransferase